MRREDPLVPALGEEETLVKVEHAGACGSDLAIYAGKHGRASPPIIMRQEFAGLKPGILATIPADTIHDIEAMTRLSLLEVQANRAQQIVDGLLDR